MHGQNNGGTASTDHKMQLTGQILCNEYALCHISGDIKFKESNSINVVFILLFCGIVFAAKLVKIKDIVS